MLACNVPVGEMTRPKLTLQWKGKTAPVPDVIFVDITDSVVKPVGARAERQVPIEATAAHGPLDECLACWKAWMHGDADRNLSIKTMRGLVGDGGGRGLSVEEAQLEADYRVGAATDAMIESMSRLHIWAIYKLCSQATPWNFPNVDLMSVGEEAREVLTQKLKKNVCTAVLF